MEPALAPMWPHPGPGPQLDQQQPQMYPQPGVQPELQAQLHVQQSQPQPQSQQPQPQPQAQIQTQAQPQLQPQAQVQAQAQPAQQQQQQQPQPTQQPQQASAAPAQQQMTGPPYVFDPNATYPDANVQAWAHYYAHGGTDPTGAVYFLSVPGVKEGPPAPAPAPVVASVQPASRESSIDSIGTLPDPADAMAYTAPLNINKAQPSAAAHLELQPPPQPQPQHPQAGAYGAAPYAPVVGSPVGEGPPVAGQAYYGLPSQFGAMDLSGEAAQPQGPGPQGVGAPA